MIFNITGGGGAALNFKVVGGTSEPSSPTNNTIWVNTSADITSWEFSSVQPSSPENGMVWFTTGTSSPAAFNALKKNSLQIYPISAKQYISGAWESVTAKSYQGGAWVDWIVYLYNSGDTMDGITGGWLTSGVRASSSWNPKEPTVSFNSTNMVATMVGGTGSGFNGVVYTANKIDLTDVNKIVFKGNVAFSNNKDTYGRLCVLETVTTSGFSPAAEISGAEFTDGSFLDVSSLSGSYHVAFYLAAEWNVSSDTVITCESLYLR